MIYLLEYDPAEGWDRHTEHDKGRQLLRFGLERSYGKNYEVGQMEGGKPILKGVSGIHFNISHTKGLVACVICEREIGIDVEYVRPYDERLKRRICTEKEIAYICQVSGKGLDRTEEDECFFRFWTLKESYLKATGQGISIPMREISFEIGEQGRDLDEIRCNQTGWRFRQFRYGGKFMVSVCEAERRIV